MDEEELTRRSLLAAAGAAGITSTAGCAGIRTPADVSDAASIRGNVGYFLGPSEIADRNVAFLDARSPERFRSEHVYGAKLAPFERLTSSMETDGGARPDAGELRRAIESVGVSETDDVVVYGSSVGSRVTRVVFALEYLGHEGDVHVLNGGFETWNGRVGVGTRSPSPTTYDADPQTDLVVTRDWLADRVGGFNADGPGLVDVRSPDAYLAATGSGDLVEENSRHGHVPGAVDVHWVGNVNGRSLADPGTLAQLYFDAAGLDDGDTIVTYGQDNVDPTHTFVVLRALGASDVRLYDGGFREWANVPEDLRGECPVETKTAAVVETDGEVGGDDDGGFSCTG